jgi:hypothetical protein
MNSFQPVLARLGARGHWVELANALLLERSTAGQCAMSGGGQVLQFRPSLQDESLAYEPGIFETGRVPCRTVAGGFSLVQERHDFYNAIVWLTFPKAKARLNFLSMQTLSAVDAQSSQHSVQAPSIANGLVRRGPLRDAITVFDENALLLLCSEPRLTEQLAAMQWQELLITDRAQWIEGKTIVPICFGHALLQKLETPYKAITGHSFVLPMSFEQLQSCRDNLGLIDSILCEQLTKEVLVTKPFLPLPVLGIPEWSTENQNASYYDDPQVFRKQKVTLRTV